MITKPQTALSDPSYMVQQIETDFFHVIKESERKEQEGLARLAAVLKVVEQEVADAKNGKLGETSSSSKNSGIDPQKEIAPSSSNGPSTSSLEDALAKMILILQMLQVKLTKFAEDKAQADGEISKALVKKSQENLHDLEKKLRHIHYKEREQKRIHFWEKFGEGVLTVVTIAAGLALAQPELLVMGALSIASTAGLFEYATKELAHGLEYLGAPKSEAEADSAIIVCGLTIIACLLFPDPEEGMEETAEAGTEIGGTTSKVGENAANVEANAEKQVSTLKSILQKIADSSPVRSFAKLFQFIVKFNKAIGSTGRILTLATMTTIQDTQLVTKYADALMDANGDSKKYRKKVDQDINYTMMAVTLMVSILTTLGSAGATSTVSRGANLSYQTTKSLLLAQKMIGLLFGLGLGAAGITQGEVQKEQGELEKGLGEIEGNTKIISTILGVNSTQIQQDQKYEEDILKQQSVGNRSISELVRGEAGFANLFTSYSPV